MKYELRTLSFGQVLGEAFNLYFDNFPALFLIALFSNMPEIILELSSDIKASMGNVVVVMFRLAVNSLTAALVIELVSRKYLKQHQTFGSYIKNVMRFFFPVLGLVILQASIVGVPGLFLAAVSPVLLVLYIIPALYVIMGYILASQVLIVEKKSILDSIKRSFDLTQYNKLIIFGFILILFAINYGTGRILIELLLPTLVKSAMAVNTKIMIWYVTIYLAQVLISPIGSCILILVYFNLRIEKEGFDLEHLVDQFSFTTPQESNSSILPLYQNNELEKEPANGKPDV